MCRNFNMEFFITFHGFCVIFETITVKVPTFTTINMLARDILALNDSYLKPCSHVTLGFAFMSNVKNGFYGTSDGIQT